MLMEAMQRVRAAEDAARQRRKETEQECAQILRTAQEELAREENVLRATLKEKAERRQAELEARLHEEEVQARRVCSADCQALAARGKERLVEAVRRIAEEVASGCQSLLWNMCRLWWCSRSIAHC